MRVRVAVPDAATGPEVLESMLEAVTRTNEVLLDKGRVPLASEAIAAGVRWKPEPPGDEHFDHAATVVARGWGDCDDLAPYQAASLRVTGEDPGARATVIKSGPKRWHAIVERSDGSIDDPSADAGMYEYRRPIQPKLAGSRNGMIAVATKPVCGVWAARVDAPFQGVSGCSISGHCFARYRGDAVAGALEGVATVGIGGKALQLAVGKRVIALHQMLHGVSGQEVGEELGLGPDVVGRLKKTAKTIGKVYHVVNPPRFRHVRA